MNAQDYPISEGYGWQKDYPLHTSPGDPVIPYDERSKYPGRGYGFHTGLDYACPPGSPILVNGIIIGLSGDTGKTFGPHFHKGRYVGGWCTNPIGGFTFKSAVVTEVGQDADNGKFIRIQGDNASWVYLHLSKQSVKVGDKLEGEPMFNEGDRSNINDYLYGEDRGQHKDQVGKPWKEAIYGVFTSKYFADESRVNNGDLANIASWGLGDATSTVGKIWKKFAYDYVSKNVPQGEYELIQGKVYKEKGESL